MNRAQRKANLKKLLANSDPSIQNIPQIQENNRRLLRSSKSREVQDSNANIDHEEKVVASNDKNSEHAQTLKRRLNLTRFIFKSKSDRPTNLMQTEHDSDDFETPVKKIKRAPILSQQSIVTTNTTTKTTNNVRKKKRQQKITTAFLRNEQMFSDVAAQHSAAENFNPDEVQLALALSRSEVETRITNKCTVSIDKVDDCKESTSASVEEDIRSKLKNFGFRTANKEDYVHCFAAAFLNNKKRTKTKSKWGNKFTALTLRDPKIQSKKLCSYIEKIINQWNQKTATSSQDDESKFVPYQLRSSMLSQHSVTDETVQIFRNMEYISTTEQLERFFIADLFPVTKVPPGHLLKDWKIIPGRDLSPNRECKRVSGQARKYKKFYEELDSYASSGKKDATDSKEDIVINAEEENTIEPTSPNELDELLHLIANTQNDIEDEKKHLEQKSITIQSSTSMDYMEEIPKTTTSPRVKAGIDKEEQYLSESSACVKHVDFILTSSTEASQSLRTQQQHSSQELDIENTTHSNKEQDSTVDRLENAPISSRETLRNTQPFTGPTSPDLFADSDSDDTGAVEENKANNITTYEVYSSDDVKTSSEAGCNTDLLSVKADVIVDLTQDVEVEISKSKKHDIQVSKRLNFLDFPNECTDLQQDVESEKTQYAKALNETISKTPNKSLSVDDIPHTTCWFDLAMSEGDQRRKVLENKNNEVFQKNNSVASIDLTQSDNDDTYEDDDNDNDVCILLSDDEVNYSIMKASAAACSKMDVLSADNFDNSFDEEQLKQLERSQNQIAEEHNFSVLDLIDVEHSFQVNIEQNEDILQKNVSFNLSGDIEPINEEYLTTQYQTMMNYLKTPTKPHTVSNVLKERAEFGILESQSEPFSQTPPHWMRTPAKVTATPQKTSPQSFSSSISHETQQWHHSTHSNSKKFQSFLFDHPKAPDQNVTIAPTAALEYDDFDEFDRLVYGSPLKRTEMITLSADVPAGLSQLLTGEISFGARSITKSNETQSPSSLILKALTPEKTTTTTKTTAVNQEEITINNHVYIVRITSSTKPNFSTQTDAELLKQLYNFGIKPLKRNQAIKLLEYIYNETHPIIDRAVCDDNQIRPENVADNISECSSVAVCSENDDVVSKKSCIKATKKSTLKNFKFQDCYGDFLLRFAMELSAELRDEEEIYIYQTNITKKTQQPLVPLHIAWFNLVCSNPDLHESIVMYEPIDLQEIYLFLKSLGYRYDPKDLKRFFDRRCIIFRYDLTPQDKQDNRHIRNVKNKKFKNGTQKCAKSQRTLEKYLSL